MKQVTGWLGSRLKELTDSAFKGALSAFVAALVAWLTNYLNKDEIQNARDEVKAATKILNAKNDYETAFTLMGRLSSNENKLDAPEKEVYLSLLEHLQSNAKFDPQLKQTIGLYIARDERRNTQQQGAGSMATVEVKPQQIDDVQTTLASYITSSDLPVRLYIQIADDSQQALYNNIVQAFKGIERVKVPPVETVGSKAPKQNDLRYCPNGTQQDVAQAVHKQIETVIRPITLRQLPEGLCRAVRQNHVELWVAKGGGK